MRMMGERRNRSSTMVILLVTVIVIAFVAWSLWATIDTTSRALGVVMTAGKVQVIQSPDGGEITEILPGGREGATVKHGQLLIVLDKVKLAAAVEESRARVAAYSCAMARIKAELVDKALVFPGVCLAYPEFVANQRLLDIERRAALKEELAGFATQKKLIEEEIALNEPLIKSGAVAASDVIQKRRIAADLGTQASVRRGRYVEQLQAEFTKTQEDLVTAEQILTQRQDALKNAEILAPTNGIVKNVRLTTVGGVFRPGDEVLTIVPTGEDLIVEAKVSPSDRAYVKEGQEATVKFDSYDSSIYGSGTGTVTYISPDTLVEQRPDGKAEAAFYRVHLKVKTEKMRTHLPGERITILPGMTAIAEIKTGEDTVFNKLTKPILKTARSSLTER